MLPVSCRILGGKSVDDLQLGGITLEGLAGDERFAEREEQRALTPPALMQECVHLRRQMTSTKIHMMLLHLSDMLTWNADAHVFCVQGAACCCRCSTSPPQQNKYG
jgi:hypothetical protein